MTAVDRNRLVTENLRLVPWVIKRYRFTQLDHEDLVQEGNLGLIKAVDTFDSTHGTTFSTYAVLVIKREIQRAVDNRVDPVRVPVYLRTSTRECPEARHHLEVLHGLAVATRCPLELDAPVRGFEDGTTHGERLGSGGDLQVELEERDQRAALQRCLRRLPFDRAATIRLRLDGREQREIAHEHGVSHQAIAQREQLATFEIATALETYPVTTPVPRFWTTAEIRRLEEASSAHRGSQISLCEQLALELGRSPEAIALKLRKREMARKRPWLIPDDNLLRDLVGTCTVSQAAKKLRRSEPAVRVRLRLLGLHQTWSNWCGVGARRQWSDSDDHQLRTLAGERSASEIAVELGRSKLSIKNRLHVLGLSYRRVA